jgi:hypothetical protein
MKNTNYKLRFIAFGLAALLVLLTGGLAGAGSSASYSIDWHVFSGGGAPGSSANFSLNGSLGQTAIGPSSSSNVGLSSGYWRASASTASPGNLAIYLPLLIR